MTHRNRVRRFLQPFLQRHLDLRHSCIDLFQSYHKRALSLSVLPNDADRLAVHLSCTSEVRLPQALSEHRRHLQQHFHFLETLLRFQQSANPSITWSQLLLQDLLRGTDLSHTLLKHNRILRHDAGFDGLVHLVDRVRRADELAVVLVHDHLQLAVQRLDFAVEVVGGGYEALYGVLLVLDYRVKPLVRVELFRFEVEFGL